MKKKILFTLLLLLTLISICACQKDPILPVAEEEEEVFVALTEPTPLELSETQLAYLGSANRFSDRMLQQMELLEDETSYFYSPISLSFALTMLLNGTGGDAAKELSAALGYGASFDAATVNDYCRQYIQRAPSWDPDTDLSFANALFVNQTCPIKDNFKNTLRTNFFAKVKNLDFSKRDETLGYINDWCNDKTSGMIPNLLDNISPMDLLYLINVVYFKGAWANPFEEINTKREPFTRKDGSKRNVFMMRQMRWYPYAETTAGACIELEYGQNGAFTMQILLPRDGDTRKAAEFIATNGWDALLAEAKEYEVDVKLPRFSVKSSLDLEQSILPAMGIRKIFSSADFSGISDAPLNLSAILQKAAISVDETGAEAAAATVEIESSDNEPPKENPDKKYFYADRPFFFAIVEKQSGAVLFFGKYGA